MTSVIEARPARRIVRSLRRVLLIALLLAPPGIALLALEGAPRVPQTPPPSAATSALTRDLAASLHQLVASEGAAGSWSVDEPALQAALVSAGRILPDLRVAGRLVGDTAVLDLSLGPPTIPGGLWLNAGLTVAASADGIAVSSARLGRLPLPPALVLPLARLLGDHALGNRLASLAIDAMSAVRIDPPMVTLEFDPEARSALFAQIRSGIRDAAGGDSEAVYVHLWYLARAAEQGRLPSGGSLVPYLRHILTQSAELDPDDPAQIKAGLLALALYCGDGALGPVIGVSPRDASRTACAGTTLGGRDDLRRHFTISAGIEAARSGQAAIGVGELKELLDSNAGGTGFSFDDMAANLAGVRFAQKLLAAPPQTWPDLAEAIAGEEDILPALEDLPTGLSEAVFEDRFGSVDSARYAAVLAKIERRIDALPLHAGPAILE